jgi:hypothetical protein
MPDWAPPGYYSGSPYGQRRLRGPRKRFYQSVFDYVFGPKGPPTDPLAAEKEVVAYLREHDGRITATDLVSLTGWGYDRAEEEATRLLAAYDGEPEVTEEGSLVYSFPELRKTAGEVEPGGWRYAWRQARPLPALTGNTSGANTAISVMNGFNLVAALSIGPAFMAAYGIDTEAARMAITYFPLAFSSIFYAVPAGRAIKRSRLAKRIENETARAQLLGEILARRGAAVAPDTLVQAATKGGIPPVRAKAALEKLLVELDGDVTTDAAGNTLYAFPRVAAELQAAEAARQLAPAKEREAGQVVFASDEEGSGEVPELPGSPERRQLH